MMPLSIFAPPSTDWLTESRRRLGTTRAAYSNAINDTRRDALGLARATAGVGSGAAASRAAMQAAAPAIADLRTAEVGAMEATRSRIAAEQMAERERQQDFMNNLFGGLAGVAGQMMVPLIGGLGGGGRAGGDSPLGSGISTSATGGAWSGTLGGGPSIARTRYSPDDASAPTNYTGPSGEWSETMARTDRIRPAIDAPLRAVPSSGAAHGAPPPAPLEFYEGDSLEAPWWVYPSMERTPATGRPYFDGPWGPERPPTVINPTGNPVDAPPGSPEFDEWIRRHRRPVASPGTMSPDAMALEEERRRRAGMAGLFGTAATAAGAVNPLAGLGVGLAGRLFG